MNQPNKNDNRLDLFETFAIIMNRKKLILTVTAIVFLVMLVWMYLTPNYYTSRASILPSEDPEMYRGYRHFVWMGALNTPYNETSSMLYPNMIRSETITDDLIDRKYEISDDGETGEITLADYFGTDNPDEIRNLLKHVLTVEIDKYGTGITFLVAVTRYPDLSRDIVAQVLTSLETFNRDKRITRSGRNLENINRELTDNRAELAAAEKRLSAYLARNRDYFDSKDPDLLMTVKRMEREIDVLEKARETLLEQKNQTRLEAAAEIASLKILDRPTAANIKSSPRRIKSALMLAVVAFLLTSMLVFAFDSFRQWSGISMKRFFKGIADESKLPERIIQE